MPTTTISRFPGLQRMLYPERKVACYRVKVLRHGEMFQEYFPFRRYGSEAAALAEAKRCWRDIEETFPRMSRFESCQIERRKSRSGIVGVGRVRRISKGRKYDFWRATFTNRRGQRKVRIFSINKYGEKEAKKRAMKTRREALAALAR